MKRITLAAAIVAATCSVASAQPSDVYALDLRAAPNRLLKFPVNAPANTSIAAVTPDSFAMDFNGTGTVLYCITATVTPFQLGTIDTTTGVFTAIGAISGSGAAEANWGGLSFDATTGTMYGLAGSNLYQVNLSTGNTTLVAPITGGPVGALYIDIAVDNNGVMIGHDIATDQMVRIDKNTGVATTLGPTGFAANFAQGMDFDPATNILYATIYTGGGTGAFCSVNTATGACTSIVSTTPWNSEMEMAIRSNATGPFQVTGVTPPQGVEGDIVQITGSGFGNNPDNICAVIMQGTADAIPLEVLTATNNLITARIGPVAPDAIPGQVMVGLGTGDRGVFTPVFNDIIPEDPQGVWVWDQGGNLNMGFAPNPFIPIPIPPPPNIKYWYGKVVNGMLMVEIDGDWMPNSYVKVFARAHNHQMHMGADLAAFCIRFRLGGSPQYCASRIADTIRCAFLRRGIIVNVQIQPVPGTNRWKITVVKKSPTGPVPIDWGNLIICAQMPIKINPWVWDPITAFYNAGLIAQTNPPAGVVNGLDLTGNDGATITPMMGPWTRGVRIELLSMNLQSANSSMTLTGWGATQLMGPDQRLGRAGLRRVNSFFDVFADFSDIGGTQARVQIYNNTLPVADVVVPISPTGSIGTIGPVPGQTALARPNQCGKLPPPLPPFPPFPPCFWINFDGPFIANIGGQQFRGNNMRILVANATDPIVNIQAFDIAAGIASPNDGGGAYTITGVAEGGICYPNCDGSILPPILNVNDFQCFLNAFAAGLEYANCDGSLVPPVLNVNDFQCFLNAYAVGCP